MGRLTLSEHLLGLLGLQASSWLQCFSTGGNVAPHPPHPAWGRGRLSHLGDALGILWADSRDAAEEPTRHRTAHHNKDLTGPRRQDC